ncbi:hypothetical protein A9P82_00960 [Arachidicoccus ginsenosidimutans]|nr:hypothetical protein A9P82_00960 [Arachidicoccus sp. BS20]
MFNLLTHLIEKIQRFPITLENMREWIRYENIEITECTLYLYFKEKDNSEYGTENDFYKKESRLEHGYNDN